MCLMSRGITRGEYTSVLLSWLRTAFLRVCLLDQQHLGTCWTGRFLDPVPDLLDQELWGWGMAVCVLTGDLRHTSLRTPRVV